MSAALRTRLRVIAASLLVAAFALVPAVPAAAAPPATDRQEATSIVTK